jgi:hypothetical protein
VPNTRYEIGEKEKHYFTVDMNLSLRRIKIEQDGVLVVNEFRLAPFSKTFTFDIGTSELHNVEITARLFHPIELKFDGKTVRPLL